MIYRTQLIYLKEDQEEVLDEFESVAIPIIKKHNGELLLRVRPPSESLVEGSMELPYEIHLVRFSTQSDCDSFVNDEERLKFLKKKEKSIREAVLYQGEKVDSLPASDT